MEYHFLKPKSSGKTGSLGDVKKLFKLLGQFLPLFLLAAILPFLIGFVVAPPDIGFLTRADETPKLRVWLEPANFVLSPGSETTLTVMAHFESETKLIPEISLQVASSGPVALEGAGILKSIPFNGKVELGRVTVKGESSGQAVINIPKESIKISAFDEELEISTSDSKALVR